MTPRSFTFAADRDGSHVHVTVRCGVEGQRALLGHLTMHADEWEALRGVLEPGLQHGDRAVVPVGQTAEGKLRALARANLACERDDVYWHQSLSILSPTDDVIAYASTHVLEHSVDWTAYAAGRSGGWVAVEIEGVTITIHDVPRPPPKESPPWPQCAACGSTACPANCPCGTAVADEEMPF